MPEHQLEVILELLKTMVKREYGLELSAVLVEGGNFENYQRAIAKIDSMPKHLTRATVVLVSQEDVELVRYPFHDVEFNCKDGNPKIGVTGHPDRVKEVMRLIGWQEEEGDAIQINQVN